MLIKDENYLTVQGWMITRLNLKGNDLLVYAVIFGFSQDGGWFTGSQQYLADWTNSTKRTVRNSLKSLLDNGHIEKVEYENNGVTFCKYRVVDFQGGVADFPSEEKISAPEEKISAGVGKNFPGGEEKFSANNIDNTIALNTLEDTKDTKEKDISKDTSKKKKPKPEKVAFGEYQNVMLTLDEYTRLADDFGEDIRKECIDYLGEYIIEKDYKTKSHYMTIRRWVVDAVKERRERMSKSKPRDSLEESYRMMDEWAKGHTSSQTGVFDEKWAEFLSKGD